MPLSWTEVVCFVSSFLVVNAQLRIDRSQRAMAETLFLALVIAATLYLQTGGAGHYPGFPWLVGLPGLLLGSATAACLDSLRARRLRVREGGKG